MHGVSSHSSELDLKTYTQRVLNTYRYILVANDRTQDIMFNGECHGSRFNYLFQTSE